MLPVRIIIRYKYCNDVSFAFIKSFVHPELELLLSWRQFAQHPVARGKGYYAIGLARHKLEGAFFSSASVEE